METSKASELIITVHIKPGSKKGPLIETLPDGSLQVFVREKAINGDANTAAITLLAAHYAITKSHIRLKSGKKARIKRFVIS